MTNHSKRLPLYVVECAIVHIAVLAEHEDRSRFAPRRRKTLLIEGTQALVNPPSAVEQLDCWMSADPKRGPFLRWSSVQFVQSERLGVGAEEDFDERAFEPDQIGNERPVPQPLRIAGKLR